MSRSRPGSNYIRCSLWDAELNKEYGKILVPKTEKMIEVIRWRGKTFITNSHLWHAEEIPYFEAEAVEVGVHDLVRT